MPMPAISAPISMDKPKTMATPQMAIHQPRAVRMISSGDFEMRLKSGGRRYFDTRMAIANISAMSPNDVRISRI